MNQRQRIMAVLNYQDYDRLPVVHFGYWPETLQKWAEEGHLPKSWADAWGDGNQADIEIQEKLGFDCNWFSAMFPNSFLNPPFEQKIIEELPDGSRKVLNYEGVVVLEKPGLVSIPAEIDHLLKDRASWEEHYLPRLQFGQDRIDYLHVRVGQDFVPWHEGGLEFLQKDQRDYHYGLFCGSLFGQIRNILGVEGSAYLYMDDEELFHEMIDTVGELVYQVVEKILASGAKFDFGHFWEDICFKSGPLIKPDVFAEFVGPHYKRITSLLNQHGIDIVSVDCDGKIDALLPIWLENGVNTMFPIEVGTWNASILPWREKYGRELRGVGGMNKTVFSHDRAAIDQEIERLKPLVALGGYIPCPDHRIAPDAEWDNVQYYCQRMKEVFA